MPINAIIAVCLLVLLSGCQLLVKPQPDSSVKPYLPLLSAASLGQSIAAVQRFRGTYNGQQHVMLFQVEVEPNRLAMVASTASGSTLFSFVDQQGKQSSTVSVLLPSQTNPRFVVADFQLAFWPLKTIEQALSASAYHIKPTDLGRQLWRADELIATIRYSHLDPWQGQVSFEHHSNGYRYQVETLSVDNLGLEK